MFNAIGVKISKIWNFSYLKVVSPLADKHDLVIEDDWLTVPVRHSEVCGRGRGRGLQTGLQMTNKSSAIITLRQATHWHWPSTVVWLQVLSQRQLMDCAGELDPSGCWNSRADPHRYLRHNQSVAVPGGWGVRLTWGWACSSWECPLHWRLSWAPGWLSWSPPGVWGNWGCWWSPSHHHCPGCTLGQWALRGAPGYTWCLGKFTILYFFFYPCIVTPVRQVGQSFHTKYPSSLQYISNVDLDRSFSQNMVCTLSTLLSHSYSLMKGWIFSKKNKIDLVGVDVSPVTGELHQAGIRGDPEGLYAVGDQTGRQLGPGRPCLVPLTPGQMWPNYYIPGQLTTSILIKIPKEMTLEGPDLEVISNNHIL